MKYLLIVFEVYKINAFEQKCAFNTTPTDKVLLQYKQVSSSRTNNINISIGKKFKVFFSVYPDRLKKIWLV